MLSKNSGVFVTKMDGRNVKGHICIANMTYKPGQLFMTGHKNTLSSKFCFTASLLLPLPR